MKQTSTRKSHKSSQITMSLSPHIVLFPFMSKGHIIPLLHLARHLVRRGVRITIFTTPASHSFISDSMSDVDVSITDLQFPENIPGVPPGTESTDKLPSMSLFIPFVTSTKQMQPEFEQALERIHSQSSPVTCIVSDGFLHWTLESASKFGVPRLSFYGMGYYAMAASREATMSGLMTLHPSADDAFALPAFPWIYLTRNDFDEPLMDPEGPMWDFMRDFVKSTENSYGLIMNSFDELEQPFVEYYERECKPKAWNVGPLCLAQTLSISDKSKWILWLDQKLEQGTPVLYIAFGSQAELSATQLREIALGLEGAKVSFLWVVKDREAELVDGFKEKVKERGLIVSEWVDQREILEHGSVQGFLSHCGWNSVLDGICAAVPILAWPILAEQFVNTRFVVEEIKVGLRVKRADGSVKGFVTAESLKNAAVELMRSGEGKKLRERVAEVAAAARKAAAEGGSSWKALDQLIGEIQGKKATNDAC